MTVTQVFFWSFAKSSDWFPKSWLHAEVASRGKPVPSQDSLQAVGAFWRPLASHHPLQTSSSAVPTLQGRGRHLSQQFHQQPRYGKRSLSNLADLLGQVKIFKIPKSYWYGFSMFIFIFAVRLAILGYLVSTFLGQPPIWSFLPDALLQLFRKASRGRNCIAGALWWPMRALERQGG